MDAMSATYVLKVAFLGVTVRTLCERHADELTLANKIGPLLPQNVINFFCLNSFKVLECEACVKRKFNTINEIPKPIMSTNSD